MQSRSSDHPAEAASLSDPRGRDRGKGTFVFSLATQFENLGDCLINELLLRELARHGRVVVLARGAPEWLRKRLAGDGAIVVCRGWPGFLREVRGGALRVFFFKPGHWVARPGVICVLRLAAVTAVARLLRAGGWKLARVGTSLDDYGAVEAWWQGALGRLHTLYGVRDEESAAKARGWRITAVEYTPDLAFLLPEQPAAGDRARLAVALSMRQRPWMGEEATNLRQQLKRLSVELAAACGSLRVVQQVAFDARLSELLGRELGCVPTSFAQTEESAAAVLQAYGTSALVVSNRLHGLLFGWACGAVPLAVVDGEHDVKTAALFRQVGLEELLLPASRIAELPEVAMHVIAHRDEWRRRLQSVFAAERGKLRAIFAAETWNRAEASACP